MNKLGLLLLAIPLSAQIQNIPNTTFPAVRSLLNSNFTWISNNMPGTTSCPTNQVMIKTMVTPDSTACVSLTASYLPPIPWTQISGIPIASGAVDGILLAADWTSFTAKAPAASPTFTGTVTLPITGSVQCLHVSSVGVVTGTGSDCGVGSGSGADASGYYLVTRAANAPANATNLGSFSTGPMKLSVAGGIATPSTAPINLASEVTGVLAAASLPAALSSSTSINGVAVTAGKTFMYIDTPVVKAQTPLTTKGDMWATDGTTMHRIGVGTDGYLMSADAASADGLKWIAPPTSVLPPQAGQSGKYLTTDGTAASWGVVTGGTGNITSGGTSTDKALAVWNGTTGTVLQNSGCVLSGGTLNVLTCDSFIATNGGPQSLTNQTAPATPAAGILNYWADSTNKGLWSKDDAGNLTRTVATLTSPTLHNFVTGLGLNGVLTAAPIVSSDLPSTISNVTFDNSNTFNVASTRFTIQDTTAPTKQLRFVVSGITAGQTRTITMPDANVVLGSGMTSSGTPLIHQLPVFTSGTDITGIPVPTSGTLLSGVLASDPVWSTTPTLGVVGALNGALSFANTTSGTVKLQPDTGALGSAVITLPAATGTVAVAPTDTTITHALFATSFAGLPAFRGIASTDVPNLVSHAFDNTNTYTTLSGNWTMQYTSDVTRQMNFALSGISTGQTRTMTIPDASGTLMLTATAVSKTQTPLQQKGDLWTTDGTTMNRLVRGTDGQILTTDSAQTNGLRWATSGGGTGTVTQINTAGPITGGPITTTGTIDCPTCVTAPATAQYDLVSNGADPTGVAAADSVFAAAHAFFNGKRGGTITGCGIFTVTQPIIITNPGLLYASNCGVSGSALGSGSVALGGFTIQSTTNYTVPAPTAGPLATASISNGALAAGTFYIATTLVNGAGETTRSPSTTAVIASGTTGSITVSYPQYQSGGVAYNVYCSTDNSTFWLQPSANFNGSGTNSGPPFMTGIGTSSNQVLRTCTTSGTGAPGANTANHGLFLVQVGTSATNVQAGPTFQDVTFLDPSFNTLGGGIVIVQAQRTKIKHCYFRGFQWAGTAPGGMAIYEKGAIAIHMMGGGSTATSTSNFNSIEDVNIESAVLGVLNIAPDSDISGGNITIASGTVGIDQPRGSSNLRISNLHMALTGSGGTAMIAIRGNSAGGKYGDIITNTKIEGLANMTGPGVLLASAHNMRIDLQCSGDSALGTKPCVQLDASSSGNVIDIANQLTQCPFSDGTTCFVDPSNANVITHAGTTNGPAVYVNGDPLSLKLASGTAALGTSAIASGACATVVTVAATGTATTDVISFTPNADLSAVTGYSAVTTGALTIYHYPTTNNVNFKVCNSTASSITPGAVTLNWRIDR